MRILLADDQTRVRFALRVLLERQTNFQIVGEAIDAQDLMLLASTTDCNLILLDWELPGLPPACLVSMLRKTRPHVYVIALSGRPEARRASMEAGADAFVSKTDPPERLLAAINNCAAPRSA